MGEVIEVLVGFELMLLVLFIRLNRLLFLYFKWEII